MEPKVLGAIEFSVSVIQVRLSTHMCELHTWSGEVACASHKALNSSGHNSSVEHVKQSTKQPHVGLSLPLRAFRIDVASGGVCHCSRNDS